jgi:hypothetical protein
VKKPFEAQVHVSEQELLTNKDQVLSGWNKLFEQNLNEREGRIQPPDKVDLRDDGVEIDLTSREKFKAR